LIPNQQAVAGAGIPAFAGMTGLVDATRIDDRGGVAHVPCAGRYGVPCAWRMFRSAVRTLPKKSVRGAQATARRDT
jgi:hypothetical protein